jgi:hypothetical protein
MTTIRKKMDNEASRRFWESFPKPGPHDKKIALPLLGEFWWEEERKLSFGLLSFKKEEGMNMEKEGTDNG